MDDSEKITGKKIFEMFEQLKNNHTMMNIHIMDTDFEGLSIILGFSDGEHPLFFIDYPGRPDAASPFKEGKKCYFEFTDEDRIPYRFKTTIYSIFENRIKFNFPEFIERAQQRKAFRISVPSGTKLLYRHNNKKFEFNIINVSESGLFSSLKAVSPMREIFYKGNILEKLSLSSKTEDFSVLITFQSMEIVWIDNTLQNGRISLGLKIIDINKNDQDGLRRFIYYCQRRLLKKRGGL